MSIFLATLALVPMSLDLIVFDDGEVHILTDQSVVLPSDDIEVIFDSPSLSPVTLVLPRMQTQFRNAFVRRNGLVEMIESSQALGDVVVDPRGRFIMRGQSMVSGALRLIGSPAAAFGPIANCFGSGSIGSLEVPEGATALFSGATRIEGSAMILGRATLKGSSIGGPVTVAGTHIYQRFVADFEGDITIGGDAIVSFGDSTFASSVTLEGNSTSDFYEGNAFGGVIHMLENASATVHMRTANVPAGDLLASSGIVIGTDLDGNAMSFSFNRDAGTQLTIDLSPDLIGEVICTQPQTNSTGQVGRLRVAGSNVVSEDNLTLIAASIPPNSFGFFFVGTAQGFTPTQQGFVVCVGDNIGRFVGPGQIQNSGADAMLSIDVPLTTIPGNPATPVLPGSTFVFQAWHRDVGPQGVLAPLTEAVQVTFE